MALRVALPITPDCGTEPPITCLKHCCAQMIHCVPPPRRANLLLRLAAARARAEDVRLRVCPDRVRPLPGKLRCPDDPVELPPRVRNCPSDSSSAAASEYASN